MAVARKLSLLVLPPSMLFAMLCAGCSSAPDPRELDPAEKAKMVTRLQRQAEIHLGKYRSSEGDPGGVDSEALLAYRDCHREITRIMGPSEHPNAYGNYGEALSRVGVYYRTLAMAYEDELAKVSGKEAREIEAKVARYRAEAASHFRNSNNQLRIYLENQTGAINPKAYHAAVSNCVELDDWQQAKDYLELLIATGTLTERARTEAKGQLRIFEEKRRRQEEAALERELEGGDAEPEAAN